MKAFLIAILAALGFSAPVASFEATILGGFGGWTLIAAPHEGAHACSLMKMNADDTAGVVITFKDPVGFIIDVYSDFNGSALNLAGITFSKSHQRLSYIYALVPEPPPLTRAQIYVGEDQIMYYEMQRPENVMQIALGDKVYDFNLYGYDAILPAFIKCIETDFVNG